MPLIMVDWSSKKLDRMCRSSLSAEAQAAANAVDSLEWTKVYISCLMNPYAEIKADETVRRLGISPVATDSRALYDASQSMTSGLGIQEERTAIAF